MGPHHTWKITSGYMFLWKAWYGPPIEKQLDFQNNDRQFLESNSSFVKNNNSTSFIPPLCSALPFGDNQWHFNDQYKANCLNDYFASISTVNDENTQLPPFTKLTLYLK